MNLNTYISSHLHFAQNNCFLESMCDQDREIPLANLHSSYKGYSFSALHMYMISHKMQVAVHNRLGASGACICTIINILLSDV